MNRHQRRQAKARARKAMPPRVKTGGSTTRPPVDSGSLGLTSAATATAAPLSLRNDAHVRHLPANWGTLAELATLTEEQFEHGIETDEHQGASP